MSDSVRPHRWQPTRLPHPWDSPGKNTGMGCHFLLPCTKVKSESEVTQSCPSLSDPMDCSLPGSSIHRIFQARVLEWGATSFSDPTCRLTYFTVADRRQETPGSGIKDFITDNCCGQSISLFLHWSPKYQFPQDSAIVYLLCLSQVKS